MEYINYRDRYLFERLRAFNSATTADPAVRDRVFEILERVRIEGDSAIREYTAMFDGFELEPANFRVPAAELEEAAGRLEGAQKAKIREAIECVRVFHERGLPRSWRGTNPHGAEVGEQWVPIDRVGIYIPAGNVPLVSTAVMTIPLAKLAGVREIVVFTPGGRTGQVSPQMLAGLQLCGASEVYRIGGAQAIAAMAFGTQTIPRCFKIMGPGNAYVAEAQRQVFGEVGVDLIPGPSEALALADETARADWLAADLIAQAEHGSGKERIYFVTTSGVQAESVKSEVERQIPLRKHATAIRKVWDENTLFIEVPHFEAAIEVINFIAPEHLELHVRRERWEDMLPQLRTAGAILCGHTTPTVLGDFTAGPSHTLPTGGTGRFFSGLKITDFMRRSSVVSYDPASLAKAREVVEVFADLEDLDGHGYSMEIRFEDPA